MCFENPVNKRGPKIQILIANIAQFAWDQYNCIRVGSDSPLFNHITLPPTSCHQINLLLLLVNLPWLSPIKNDHPRTDTPKLAHDREGSREDDGSNLIPKGALIAQGRAYISHDRTSLPIIGLCSFFFRTMTWLYWFIKESTPSDPWWIADLV